MSLTRVIEAALGAPVFTHFGGSARPWAGARQPHRDRPPGLAAGLGTEAVRFVDSLESPVRSSDGARYTGLVWLRWILLDLERWLEAPPELDDDHAEAQ